MHSHFSQLRQGSVVVLSVVLCPRLPCFAAFLVLFPFLLFFGSRGWFFLRGLLRLARFPLECCFQVTTAQLSPIQIGIPIECRGLHRSIDAISPLDRVPAQCAIFRGSS